MHIYVDMLSIFFLLKTPRKSFKMFPQSSKTKPSEATIFGGWIVKSAHIILGMKYWNSRLPEKVILAYGYLFRTSIEVLIKTQASPYDSKILFQKNGVLFGKFFGWWIVFSELKFLFLNFHLVWPWAWVPIAPPFLFNYCGWVFLQNLLRFAFKHLFFKIFSVVTLKF